MNSKLTNTQKREKIFELLDEYSLKDLLAELLNAGFQNPMSLFDDHPEGRDAVEEMIDVEEFIDAEERSFLIPPKLDLLALLYSLEMEAKYGEFEKILPKKSDPAKILHFPTHNNSDKTHQLKLSMNGATTPIWRKIELPSDSSLADLHDIIQILFEWDDCHLHAFYDGTIEYKPANGEPTNIFKESRDESQVALYQIFIEEKHKIQYVYDFGDDHSIEISLEKVTPKHCDGVRLISGKRMAPPEDCGGMYQFETIRTIAQDKKHPQFKEIRDMAEIMGMIDHRGNFCEEIFDKEYINLINSELELLNYETDD